MISTQIISSDAFLDMPMSSQLLYFHLVMAGDDDGFVGNPRKITKVIGANEDDFKILLAKRFILTFESGVIVIKHWLIHNSIRGDRYHPTQYQDERKLIITKENKAYTEKIDVRQPIGNQRLPEVKLSKVKLSKEIVASDTPFSLEEEIKKLEESPRRDLNIIALYFEYRKPDLQNYEQYSQAIRRHLKPAGALKGFSDSQIMKAIEYAKKEYKDIYTLETLLKILVK